MVTTSLIIPSSSLLRLRELYSSEAPACRAFFERLDREDIRLRFGSVQFSMSLFFPAAGQQTGSMTFAAFDAQTMLGVINIVPLSRDTSELGLIVRSDYKRQGIGRFLLTYVIHQAERCS